MRVDKKGADGILGTNFSGTIYTVRSESKWRLRSTADGAEKAKGETSSSENFYNTTRLGAPDHDTFPQYFLRGLPGAAREVAKADALRAAVGLPTLTPTPTHTPTPGLKAVSSSQQAELKPTATPVPTPEGPYWINPKTGKKVDPKWNFDPEDGTPRSKFILKNGK
jgi:hypothetical protein